MFYRLFHLLGAAMLGLMSPLDGQDFEGTVEYRLISVQGSAVRDLLGLDSWGDEPIQPSRAFTISVDQALQVADRRDGSAEVETATYRFEGSRVRFDTEDGYAIMDVRAGSIQMVQPVQRIYIELTLEQLTAMGQGAGSMDQPGRAAGRVQRLDLSQTVNGVNTTAYQVQLGPEVTRAWMTGEHSALVDTVREVLDFTAQMSDGGDAVVMDLLMEHGFPMRTMTIDTETGGLQLEEFLTIEAGSVGDSLFEIPANFTRQTIPGM